MIKVAALIGAALVIAPAATAREMVQTGSWRIAANEGRCAATGIYVERQTEKPVYLAVDYDAKSDRAKLAFTTTQATSVTEGATKELGVLLLYPGTRLDAAWGTKTFAASIVDGDQSFKSDWLERKLLDDVAKGQGILFITGEVLVSAFDLSGSAKAMAELRKCAFEAAGLHPDDPFLR